MLLEVLNPICIDKKVICNSFRLNINSNKKQMRCKIDFPENKNVDLVIYEYTEPKIDGFGVLISFEGEELETETEFKAKIKYNIMEKGCKFKGKLGKKEFSFTCKTIVNVIEKIGELINPGSTMKDVTIVPTKMQSTQTIEIRRKK